jgi:SHS2 domain-containing protein
MGVVRGHEILEHTADVAIRAVAPDRAGLLEELARALFEIITDPDRVRPAVERRIRLTGDRFEDILHDWLEELNTLHQIHRELYGTFGARIEGNLLEGTARGEPIDFQRHDLRTEVKAVTWHGLRVDSGPGGYTAEVLLDI